jgi:hypothetical protein
MATVTDIAIVREQINDPDLVFPDERIGDLIDSLGGDLAKASAHFWRIKASRFAELVDIQEGTSRRSLSQLYDQALNLAGTFDAQSIEVTETLGIRPGRTRPIVRP